MLHAGRRFAGDERGAVAATYAIGLAGLLAIAGVAFDYGRLVAMDTELQNGADQAALAGASQLDGKSGACARAAQAARNEADGGLLNNITLLASDGTSNKLAFPSEPACDATGQIRFFKTVAGVAGATTTVAADSDATANYIELNVNVRAAQYVFTPIVGAFNSGAISAAAMAGLTSAICKVPPLMICSPNPSQPFNSAAKKGWGVMATGHGGGNTAWAAGDFGFLEIGNSQKSDLERALAFKEVPFDCAPISGTRPETGNAQGLFRAINTRFDIYDDSGQPLNQCQSGGKCPAAANVVKDLVKDNTNTTGNNSCRTHGQGWHLPTNQFFPRAGNQSTDNNGSTFDADGVIDAMGLTRDLCHYTSYVAGLSANRCNTLNGLGGADPDTKFGSGRWARRDYFNKYHSGGTWPPAVGTKYLMDPADATSFTRYGIYKWEQAQANIPTDTTGNNRQIGTPICSTGSADGLDRRVLTLAIVKNCAQLAGGSQKVEVDEWIDAFLVEPTFDARGNGAGTDAIYFEVIGPASVAGGGAEVLPQTIRRDVPYLIR